MRSRSLFVCFSVSLAGLAAIAACVGDDPGSTSTPNGDGGNASSSGGSSGTASSSGGSSGSNGDATTDTTPPPPPGTLDTTFVNGPYSGVTMQPTAVAVDGMGRVYVGGNAQCTSIVGAFSNQDVAVARFDAKGTLDATWGSSGRACVSLAPDGSTSDNVALMAIDNAGKLVVAATQVPCNDFGCTAYLTMLRFNTDGTPDGTFGTGGVGKMTVSSGNLYKYSAIQALVLDGAQIYIAGGQSGFGAETTEAWIVRFQSNGSPDTAFGANGVQELSGIRPFSALALRSGIAYAASMTANEPPSVIVHAFTQAGQDAGTFLSSLGTMPRERVSGIFAPTTGFIMGGATELPDANGYEAIYGKPAIAKIDNAGAKDNGFGASGTAKASALTVQPYEPRLAIQKDGKLLVTGSVDIDRDGGILNMPTKADFAIARFNANGQPDTAYGTNGMARPGTMADTELVSMALDPSSDKLVVLSRNRTTAAHALYRFNP